MVKLCGGIHSDLESEAALILSRWISIARAYGSIIDWLDCHESAPWYTAIISAGIYGKSIDDIAKSSYLHSSSIRRLLWDAATQLAQDFYTGNADLELCRKILAGCIERPARCGGASDVSNVSS